MPMIISSRLKTQAVTNGSDFEKVLHNRDAKGGGEFWISATEGGLPCLVMVVSGPLGHVIYFPEEGHPGYRALRSQDDALAAGYTLFIWESCDPGWGEEIPNAFVLPFETALKISLDFFHTQMRSQMVEWFEL